MKRLLFLISISVNLFAQNVIEVLGASYLKTGENIYYTMDTNGFKNGDIVDVVDKRDKKIYVKARVKNLKDGSLILQILPTE